MHTTQSRSRARRKAERGRMTRQEGNRRIVVVEDDPDVRALLVIGKPITLNLIREALAAVK